MPNPNEVYKKLKKLASNDRVRRTLDAIHCVCTEQMDRGSRDFSIATISRLGQDTGVPKAQSIRNKTGEPYRVLINAWQNSQPNQLKAPKTRKKDGWVEEIAEPTYRFLVQDLIAHNKRLENEMRVLKSVKTLDIDMRGNYLSSPSGADSMVKLLSSERDALAEAIATDFLKRRGWHADKRGKVIDNDKKTVFKNGFVTGIEKILAISEKD